MPDSPFALLDKALTPETKHRASRRGNLVKTADRGCRGRGMKQFRSGFCFGGYGQHGIHKAVQGFLALGLRRLYHQRLGHYQGEVDGGRMETVIDQALGYIQGADAGSDIAHGHELVHAGPRVLEFVGFLQPRPQVVRVQDRVFRYAAQTFGSLHPDVAIGADQDAEVTVESLEPTDAFLRHRQLVFSRPPPGQGSGQEGGQFLDRRHHARPGASPSVGRGKGFMQVEVHNIDAALAGLEDPGEGVHVGPVPVHQAAGLVYHGGYLRDIPLKEAEGVGVGDHYPGHIVVQGGFQGFDVDVAILAGGNCLGAETGHGAGGGVRSVGGVGDEHFFTLSLPPGLEAIPDHEHARQLSMGPRRRLEGNGGETAYLGQAFLQLVEQFQGALGFRIPRKGVDVLPSRLGGCRLVRLGVVFHGAGPQGIEMGIDGVVFLGKPGEVPHHRKLIQFGQIQIRTNQILRQFGRGNIRTGQRTPDQSGARQLEYKRFRAQIHSAASLSAATKWSISALPFNSVTQTRSSFSLAES
ncbi:hypothetical protein TRIP_E300085 [uncultured Spirochaetota bacterium]|uniref:Uncharacterized protein n=1 Tax=uncultured Spirochaetota bacterium TaxID=460511 RepID=A0A652ZXM3_9SPIR|nr:hypothetical protein TRIP_E300085 [uncultured Spirochaetota bacterium]